jgi:hypothetical protein
LAGLAACAAAAKPAFFAGLFVVDLAEAGAAADVCACSAVPPSTNAIAANRIAREPA